MSIHDDASAPYGARRCGPASARALFPPLLLGPKTSRQLPEILAQMEVAGGAVYDALVALAAAEHGADLAGHPRRPGKRHPKDTYERVGVRVIVAAGPG